jgi:hypothetical protein
MSRLPPTASPYPVVPAQYTVPAPATEPLPVYNPPMPGPVPGQQAAPEFAFTPNPIGEPQWCESPYRNSAWRLELDFIPTSSQVSDQAFGDWDDSGGFGMRLTLGYEDCDGTGIRAVLWGFGQNANTLVGDVELDASTFALDLYKRFYIEDAELVLGGGSTGAHLEYDLDALGMSAEFRGGGISVFGEVFYPFVHLKQTEIGQVARARVSLLSGRWDDNGTPFMADTGHDTMTILDIAWGLELRHRFGKLQDKYWYIAIVPEFQRWESATLPNAFDPGFQGTNFNFGLAW